VAYWVGHGDVVSAVSFVLRKNGSDIAGKRIYPHKYRMGPRTVGGRL
jgi:hypothetical protein